MAFPEQHVLAGDAEAINGAWSGSWSEPGGYVFHAEMRLKVGDDGKLEGEITWTMKKAPKDADQSKVGLTGVKLIKGKFDSQSGLLTFEGYQKNDPDDVIGLDKYKLMLGGNGKVIGGITADHGTWLGIFRLRRADQPDQ